VFLDRLKTFPWSWVILYSSLNLNIYFLFFSEFSPLIDSLSSVVETSNSLLNNNNSITEISSMSTLTSLNPADSVSNILNSSLINDRISEPSSLNSAAATISETPSLVNTENLRDSTGFTLIEFANKVQEMHLQFINQWSEGSDNYEKIKSVHWKNAMMSAFNEGLTYRTQEFTDRVNELLNNNAGLQHHLGLRGKAGINIY